MKFLKFTLIFAIITSSVFFGINFLKKPIQITPYPYLFTYKTPQAIQNIKSDLLILGDKAGQSFSPYINDLIQNLSINLRSPLIIKNLSNSGMGIHRIAKIIKEIKNLPPVIILFTGSEEYLEKTFYAGDYETIKSNFKIFENEKLVSLIMAFPFLSKFLYKNIRYQMLSKKISPLVIYKNDMHNQKIMELKFKLFQTSLIEIVEYLNEKNKKLIIVSPAINYEEITVKSCSNSTNRQLEETFNFSLKNLDKLKLKHKFIQLQVTQQSHPGNSKLLYLLSKMAEKLGLRNKSREYLKNALIFDCSLKSLNPVFKAILQNIAKKYDLHYVDFNKFLGRKNAFLYKDTPQDIYFKKLNSHLESLIRQLIQL